MSIAAWLIGVITACGVAKSHTPVPTVSSSQMPVACGSRSSTTLPGVRIEFVTPTCNWTLQEAAGLRIDYAVVVDRDIDGVQPVPQDEGQCDAPGASGLILFEELQGSGQRYCLCDNGLCPGEPQKRGTLRKGRYPGTFRWDGRNWTGSSDAAVVKGEPFPAGHYTLVVSAVGRFRDGERDVTFKVTSSLELTLRE